MDVDHDWTSAVVNLILRLEVNNLGTRREIYDAAYRAQNTFIEQQDTALEPEDANFMRRYLRYTLVAIETDIRADVDISKSDYVPSGLEQVRSILQNERDVRSARRLASQRGRQVDPSSELGEFESPTSGDDAIRLQRLKRGLAVVDPRDSGNRTRRFYQNPLGVVRALFIQNLLLIGSESRIALIWTLVLPSVMLSIISLVYFLTGTTFVLGMDVPTFALLGSVTWIMSRQVIFRVSGAYAHHRMWIHIPVVNSLHTTMAMALITLVTFACVFVTLLTGGYYVGLTSLPSSPRFVIPVLGMWLFAYGIGLIFGVIASYWGYFLRFAGAIERSAQIFSSMLFVSEQLPESWKPYVLWLPTAHGMQLVRAGYFASYTAPDASPRYFAESILAVLLIGIFGIWLGRSRLEPL